MEYKQQLRSHTYLACCPLNGGFSRTGCWLCHSAAALSLTSRRRRRCFRFTGVDIPSSPWRICVDLCRWPDASCKIPQLQFAVWSRNIASMDWKQKL